MELKEYDDNALSFVCEIQRAVYETPDYKVYGAIANLNEYPFLQENKYGNITLAGNFYQLTEGVEYHVKAVEREDKYGISYDVINIKRDIPADSINSRKFLNEILTPSQVDVLMATYPDIVDRVINNRLDDIDLNKTKGIKEYTFDIIKQKIIQNFVLAEVFDVFGGYGITFNMIKRMYDHYESVDNLIRALQKDPYKALCSISGIGFKKADSIILNIPREVLKNEGDFRESKQRMEACIEYVLMENESQGNTKMILEDLEDESYSLSPECFGYFDDILEDEDVIFVDEEEEYVSRKITYLQEKYINDTIKEMLQEPRKLGIDYTGHNKVYDTELTDEQLNTLKNLCEHNVSLLVGWAGTGKTLTVKAVVSMLDNNELSYLLLAPTGKAADVLAIQTDRGAETIHRGLMYHPVDGWRYNKYNKLPYDVVVVDETGMVDVSLMFRLLEAIDIGRTRLLFIQDPDQLPSVGAGNCSDNMIHSGIIPTTTLNQIFRYAEGGLYNVATHMRKGEKYIKEDYDQILSFGENEDYTLITVPEKKIVKAAIKLYKKLIDEGSTIDDIVVLSHHNKGEYGTRMINNLIQEIINPKEWKSYMEHGDTFFVEGDKVLQIANNYKAINVEGETCSVYNGNTGVITEVRNDILNKYLVVDYGKQQILYYKEDLSQLILGYARSVHKCQGDSSKYVIFITPNAHKYFLNRNLLYTAVTRTKYKCWHISDVWTINSALKKSINKERKTFLLDLLKENNP